MSEEEFPNGQMWNVSGAGAERERKKKIPGQFSAVIFLVVEFLNSTWVRPPATCPTTPSDLTVGSVTMLLHSLTGGVHPALLGPGLAL